MWGRMRWRQVLGAGSAVGAAVVLAASPVLTTLTEPAVPDAVSAARAAYLDNLHEKAFVPWNHNWDFREPEALVTKTQLKEVEAKEGLAAAQKLVQEKKPKATRHILLVRHGQYVTEAEEGGQVLTELGREQARQTGRRLKESGLVFDRVINSTMLRAEETAHLMVEEMGPEQVVSRAADSMLEEGAPFPVEPPVSHWQPESREIITEGSRIEAAFRRYFHRAPLAQEKTSYDLIVCHGNVSRYFVLRALQFPPEAWLRLSKAHGSITWLTIRPNGRVSLRTYGDAGHMPVQMVTFS